MSSSKNTPNIHNFIVDCSGTPPTFYNYRRTYSQSKQLPNLYQGATLDMRRVIGMAAPTQLLQRQTRLDVIEHELAEYELVGAHGAEWFLRPENKAAFFKVSPSGCLYFLHKESVGDMLLGLVCRHQHEGPIAISGFYAEERSKFPPDALFAVIDPAAQPTP